MDKPVPVANVFMKLASILGVPVLDYSAQFSTKYTDQEGDEITLSSDEDVQEAIDDAAGKAVRLHVLQTRRPPSAHQSDIDEEWVPVDAPQVEVLSNGSELSTDQDLPTEESEASTEEQLHQDDIPQNLATKSANISVADGGNSVLRAEDGGDKPVIESATVPKVSGVEATCSAQTSVVSETGSLSAASEEEENIPVHWFVSCDATNMYPIRGVRWHRIGDDFDLCQSAFDNLCEDEKEEFERIDFEGATPVPYATPRHHNVICDVCNENPILGTRWHKVGHNYDLCETDYNSLSEEEKNNFVAIERPNTEAKRCGMPLHFDSRDMDIDRHTEILKQTVVNALRNGFDVVVDLIPRQRKHHGHQFAGCRRRCGRGQPPHGHNNVDEETLLHAHEHEHSHHHEARHGRRYHHHHHAQGPPREYHHGRKKGRARNCPYAAMAHALIGTGEVLPEAPIGHGCAGPGVAQLQKVLVEQGFLYPNSVFASAEYDTATATAVSRFQQAVPVRRARAGEFDSKTREALLAYIRPVLVPGSVADAEEDHPDVAVAVSTAEIDIETSVLVEPETPPHLTQSPEPQPPAQPVQPPQTAQSAQPEEPQESAQSEEPQCVEYTQPAEPQVPVQPHFALHSSAYPAELAMLEEMGLTDRALLEPLLHRYRGDIAAVLAEVF
jgi:hypothetical protein